MQKGRDMIKSCNPGAHLIPCVGMKKSLSILSLGAGMMVAFTACQQTQNDYPGGYEEALPMSEMAVADGELPPWLLEDNEDGEQIPAGDYTDHSFPDDEIKVADAPAGGAAAQNQPQLAQDDTVVDSDTSPLTTEEGATIIPAPISGATESPVTKETVAAITKPAQPKPATKPGRSTADIKKLTAKEKKSIKKPKEPTVVTYKVRPGDNLTLIAKRSNTTVAQIRKDSNIKGDLIYPGQIIKVKYYPKGSKAALAEKAAAKPTEYTVKRGDSISTIASKHGVSTAALLKANNLTSKQAARIQPGRKLTIPAKGSSAKASEPAQSTIHTVKRGESISRIASRYGITPEELLKANNMTKKQADHIEAGRTLTIPAKATTKKSSKKSAKRNRR